MSIITDLLMINYSRYLGIRANKKTNRPFRTVSL